MFRIKDKGLCTTRQTFAPITYSYLLLDRVHEVKTGKAIPVTGLGGP
jgi:hypothetical protein